MSNNTRSSQVKTQAKFRNITLHFHNQGLRSYIEVDLCKEGPRQDDKGCCAHYSPVFYPTDMAHLYIHEPGLIDLIFSREHITVLDTSVTVNHSIDGDSFRCSFHSKKSGCLLPQPMRESICRHFVCPGIAWWEESKLQPWKQFFDQLQSYEIELNNRIGQTLRTRGLTLRQPELRYSFLKEASKLYLEALRHPPSFYTQVPSHEIAYLKRELKYGQEWIL